MSKCLLPGCNKQARKKFCSNKHKDRYHNLHNPRGKFAHLEGEDLFDKIDEDIGHPFESGYFGHGQE